MNIFNYTYLIARTYLQNIWNIMYKYNVSMKNK